MKSSKNSNEFKTMQSACDAMNRKATNIYGVSTPPRLERASADDFIESQRFNHLNPQMATAEPLKGSRFHVKSSNKNAEDFEFDEQFMIDAITEHYRNKKRHVIAKKSVYKFLNFPSTIVAYIYNGFTFMLCIITIALSMIYCVQGFRQERNILIIYIAMEFLLATLFLVELILHVWCCDVQLKYKKKGRMAYLFTWDALIDIFAILCFVIKFIFVVWVGVPISMIENEKLIIGFQALQIFKLLHYERYNNTLHIMGEIAWRHRKEIISTYLLILYVTTFISFLFYLFEYNIVKPKLTSLPDSLYFSVISFTTIGYGDIYPTTVGGKILITISSFIGLALVAVPSGIIGSGFAIQSDHEEKKKREQNRRLPAVLLIQNAWRRHSIVTRGRQSKSFKKFFVKLTTYGGSIIQNHPPETDTDDEKFNHQQASTFNLPKKSNFVVENYNPVDNSATITVYNGSKTKQCLTYIKISEHISNTKAYKNVFQFLSEINLNIALNNFKMARKQDSTLENVVNKIHRQNTEIMHQLNTLTESFEKAFNKSHTSSAKHAHNNFATTHTVKRAGKVDSVVNLNSNIVALDARLNRIESALKHIIETNQHKEV